jgi:gamma-glutamyltranspeptidase/glutathione hydrolase
MTTRRKFLQITSAISSIPCIAPAGKLWGKSPLSPGPATQDRLTINQAAATVHPLATQSAMRILSQGGNAIDAAISAALVLGVVDGHNSGIGGGCLVLIHRSNGEILAIDGRETASELATESMYIRDGKPKSDLSQNGPLACGVPGQIAAMFSMSRRAGRLPWEQLFSDAITLASEGTAASRSVGRTIAAEAKQLSLYPASKAIYFKQNGSPIQEGDILQQKDLAKTLECIAKKGPEWFYNGPFAVTCCQYLQSVGGILTTNDFQSYTAIDRTPLHTSYREHQIIGFPPPSSGGMHIAQMLSMLEPFQIGQWMLQQPVSYLHVLIETMKRAFADRAHWLGDSDFVDVPPSLLDQSYLAERMRDFRLDQATFDIQHGNPLGINQNLPQKPNIQNSPGEYLESDKKHTTHLTTADADGNWVAMTCTVNTSWGSKVTVPGTGVMLNNEMDDFAIAPGTPNAFGLVGSKANAVGPRKRPLSSMSPTIVLDKNNRPTLTAGAAGGPKIINATLQVLLRVLDGKLDVDSAIAAPRIHHQWRPDRVYFENEIGKNTPPFITNDQVKKLEKLGHRFETSNALAICQAIERQGSKLEAAHDPRAQGTSRAE